MILRGAAFVLGDDVNTDVLQPSRFFSLSSRVQRDGVLADRGGDVAGRILIAGRNFGIGSSRESVVRGLIAAGVVAVVARSPSRIFLRNASNLGLPVLAAPAGLEAIADGAALTLDVEGATLQTPAGTVALTPLDPYFLSLLRAGGLVALLEGPCGTSTSR